MAEHKRDYRVELTDIIASNSLNHAIGINTISAAYDTTAWKDRVNGYGRDQKKLFLERVRYRIMECMAAGHYEAVDSLKIKHGLKDDEIYRTASETAMNIADLAGASTDDLCRSVSICERFLGKERAKTQAKAIFRKYAEFGEGHAVFYERALEFYDRNKHHLKECENELKSAVMKLIDIYLIEQRFLKAKEGEKSVEAVAEKYRVSKRSIKEAGERTVSRLVALREEKDGKRRCIDEALKRAYNIALYMHSHS